MIVSDTCANGHQSAFHPLCVLHSWHMQNPEHILSSDKHAAFIRLCINCSHMQTCAVTSNLLLYMHNIFKQLSRLLPPLSFPFTDVKRYTRGHPRMLALCLEDLSTSSLVLPLNPSILLLSDAECRWFSFIYPSHPVFRLSFPTSCCQSWVATN